mmetsp:Transcript_3460/g.14107  ORF Transcript_3460/g.14107 Transcript_3460/m.14107 type:complete len:262 (+) Transcript_3460:629-1414(+)
MLKVKTYWLDYTCLRYGAVEGSELVLRVTFQVCVAFQVPIRVIFRALRRGELRVQLGDVRSQQRRRAPEIVGVEALDDPLGELRHVVRRALRRAGDGPIGGHVARAPQPPLIRRRLHLAAVLHQSRHQRRAAANPRLLPPRRVQQTRRPAGGGLDDLVRQRLAGDSLDAVLVLRPRLRRRGRRRLLARVIVRRHPIRHAGDLVRAIARCAAFGARRHVGFPSRLLHDLSFAFRGLVPSARELGVLVPVPRPVRPALRADVR